MHSQSTSIWLRAASALVIGFGVLVVVAAYPATAGLTMFLIDFILWPIDGAQSGVTPELQLIFAISGGIMVGWGVLLWLIATRLYPREPQLARSMILVSVGIWFIVDSTASIVAGAPLNALLNTSFLLMFGLPLWRTPGADTITHQAQ